MICICRGFIGVVSQSHYHRHFPVQYPHRIGPHDVLQKRNIIRAVRSALTFAEVSPVWYNSLEEKHNQGCKICFDVCQYPSTFAEVSPVWYNSMEEKHNQECN